jgi:hypothetical protein
MRPRHPPKPATKGFDYGEGVQLFEKVLMNFRAADNQG